MDMLYPQARCLSRADQIHWLVMLADAAAATETAYPERVKVRLAG